MVAHFTMHTHGVNQAFGFVEGIWLHRKSHQIRFFFRKKNLFTHTCARWNEQPSNIKNHGDKGSASNHHQYAGGQIRAAHWSGPSLPSQTIQEYLIRTLSTTLQKIQLVSLRVYQEEKNPVLCIVSLLFSISFI